jgi:hypothetical protein
MSQLPYLELPYVAKIEFYKNVENRNGKLEKTGFKDGRITSPFHFLLEIKELENSGELAVIFYDKEGERVSRKAFGFGEDGQYYEYILFFDKVENLSPGKYRYTVFLNNKLIYENHIDISND